MKDQSLSSPGQVMAKLELMDHDLAKIRHKIEDAAGTFYRRKREYEVELAKAYVDAEGANQKERESKALLSLMKSEAYKGLVTSEANYHAFKIVLSTLETRVSVCQSLLRAMTQEAA